MKFIHAADIHLDSPMRGLASYAGAPVARLRGATRQALRNLVTLALDEQIDFMLIAGDLYDGDWPDYNTGLFFAAEMARLDAAGVPVLIVQGNHDAASQITRSLRLPQNVHTFRVDQPQTIRLDALNLAVHGQGFATRQVEDNLARAFPSPVPGYFNIGLLHTSLDGRPGHAPYAPCRLEDLTGREYDYWALGHVHAPEIVARHPWVVYPGNLQGRHVRETGPRGCMLVETGHDHSVALTHHALDVVRWCHCEVALDGADSAEAAFSRIGASLQTALDACEGRLLAARLELSGCCGCDAWLRADPEHTVAECRALANQIGAHALWLERVLINTTEQASEANPAEPLHDLLHDIDLSVPLETVLDANDVSELSRKLPAELRELLTPEQIRAQLPEARALLINRLSAAVNGPERR